MKKYFLTIFLLLFFAPILLQAKDLIVYFNYAVLNLPEQSPYLEVHLKIPVSTLKYSEAGKGTYQAGVNVLITISKGKEIVYFDKYSLNSPLSKDSLDKNFSLLDLKRAKLADGDYIMEVSIHDKNDTLNKAELVKAVAIAVPRASISFSDIILLDSTYKSDAPTDFTRIGYNMLPSVLPYFSNDRRKLLFYAEVYNTLQVLQDKEFQLSYYIKDVKGNVLENYKKTRLKKPEKIIPVYDGFNITELPAGNYELITEVITENNKILASGSTFFVKLSNDGVITAVRPSGTKFPYGLPLRQLQDFMPYLSAIATNYEGEQINKLKLSKDTAAVYSWFLKFWEDRNSSNPEQAYSEYKVLADFVEKTYKSEYTKGYKTDRGAMVLKYGKPDFISPYYDEPAALPYEIWQYYNLKAQSNVKFIFYNPTQIEGDYMLLHSDAIGEVKNPQWKRMIYKRVIRQDNNIDNNKTPNGVGNDLDRRFNE